MELRNGMKERQVKMDLDFKWLVIMLIGMTLAFSLSDFAPSKTEKAKQETLKLEIELEQKKLEILKIQNPKGKFE